MSKERITDLREERDLFKKQIAHDIGVVESVYSEWENGKLSIPTNRLIQLANYFEVNIDYMLGLSNIRLHLKSSNEIDLTTVSIRLKEIRKQLKMTIRELANKLNTSSSAISNYENAKFLILGSFLIELAKYSNYSVDWILGRTEEKKIQNK